MKDASSLVKFILPLFNVIDQNKNIIDLVTFDGASNMQKVTRMLNVHYPMITVSPAIEHCVSLVFGRIMLLRPINELCDLAKKVQFALFHFISYAVSSHIYSFLYFLPTLLSLSHGHTGVLAVLRLLHIIRRVVSKVLCPLLIC